MTRSLLPYEYELVEALGVTEEEYLELLAKMPSEIRWQDLVFYETEDGTSGTQTLACTSDGNCEIVDISA